MAVVYLVCVKGRKGQVICHVMSGDMKGQVI